MDGRSLTMGILRYRNPHSTLDIIKMNAISSGVATHVDDDVYLPPKLWAREGSGGGTSRLFSTRIRFLSLLGFALWSLGDQIQWAPKAPALDRVDAVRKSNQRARLPPPSTVGQAQFPEITN